MLNLTDLQRLPIESRDLSTEGTLLYVDNLHGEDVTVNGIPFTGYVVDGTERSTPNLQTLLSTSSPPTNTTYGGPAHPAVLFTGVFTGVFTAQYTVQTFLWEQYLANGTLLGSHPRSSKSGKIDTIAEIEVTKVEHTGNSNRCREHLRLDSEPPSHTLRPSQ